MDIILGIIASEQQKTFLMLPPCNIQEMPLEGTCSLLAHGLDTLPKPSYSE